MKLFRIRGGVHPEGRKERAAERPILELGLPPVLRIPLQQHVGAAAEPVVKKGAKVKKGQLLAIGQGPVSAPVHAPTSGTVVKIGRYPAPHPSGLPGRTITLKPDGRDEWGELPPPIDDPFAADPDAIATRVAEAGVVGMGGATFPSAVKLALRHRFTLHTLVINGAECEPYLTCDDRLMREHAAEVVDGIRIMAHGLQVPRIVIAIETNKPQALRAMREAAGPFGAITVAGVPTRYPMGSEKHLVQTLTGKETPARALTADIGVVVHNAATAFAVREAVRFGRPLIARVVTVSGGAARGPGNYRVCLGTTVADLLERSGGLDGEPARLLSGGPMMGVPLPGTNVPLVKGTNGILALSAKDVRARPPRPCIRCGACVQSCPCGLMPLEMAARIRKEELDASVSFGLLDCVGCGSCAYVCPSSIPLVQLFNYAKGRLTVVQRAKHKQEETKRLAREREDRKTREAEAKRAALAQRKAAMRKKAPAGEPEKEAVNA